jgi:enamine deaminase RidA (YjgF/YER057c/UK114 family)
MEKQIIQTNAAPQAIGTYSQAIKVDNTVYLSGQIPLDPATMEIVSGDTTSPQGTGSACGYY